MALCKCELQNKIIELQKEFAALGIDVFFDNSSFRDYSAIVGLSKNFVNFGKLFIYYKPSKKTYSLKKQISDAAFEKIADAVWAKVNGCQNYSQESGIYEAFVDGSFIGGKVGYGALIYLGDDLKAKFSGTLAFTQFRQFGGELKSVVETVNWCRKNKVSKIRINYDYEGIEKFVTGVWKPKNELSQKYLEYVKRNADYIQIEWRHIKSHTGNPKNDEADKLAREAALNAGS
jgi:ribonuclease HI